MQNVRYCFPTWNRFTAAVGLWNMLWWYSFPTAKECITIYKRVLCSRFPNRLQELDKYLSFIVDISTKFPGFLFYQYHVQFAAKAAEYLEQNIRVDWGSLDTVLLNTIVAGHKANACCLCQALDHTAHFCGLNADRPTTPRPPAAKSVKSPCRYFQMDKCFRNPCKYDHVCSTCNSKYHKAGHPSCPKGKNKWLNAVTSPINSAALRSELFSHPDKTFVDRLVVGIDNGFHTGISRVPENNLECANLLSARRDKSFVKDAIAQEVTKGYLIGPLKELPFEHFRVSPIGVAQSKYSMKKRLILDSSSPHDVEGNLSINSLIDKEKYSLKYVTVDDAMDITSKLGKGTQLTKIDIKDAFRILPIHPEHRPFHCIKWENFYYVYARLAFGSRSNQAIFTQLSQALHYIATVNYGVQHLLFLLDDF